MPLGARERGADGCMWEVSTDKRGRLYWKRLGDLFPDLDGGGGCLRAAGGGGGSAGAAGLDATVAALVHDRHTWSLLGDPDLWSAHEAALYLLALDTPEAPGLRDVLGL